MQSVTLPIVHKVELFPRDRFSEKALAIFNNRIDSYSKHRRFITKQSERILIEPYTSVGKYQMYDHKTNRK